MLIIAPGGATGNQILPWRIRFVLNERNLTDLRRKDHQSDDLPAGCRAFHAGIAHSRTDMAQILKS
jgi:hypothetical protein